MIARLTGTVVEKTLESLTLDVGGVGYEISVAPKTTTELAIDAIATLYIAEAIREDQYTLYGFARPSERSTYYHLTSVTGVGPKAAMAILAAHSSGEIEQAIVEGKIAMFSAVSGVGTKTAQRIILDLRGKLALAETKVGSDDPAYQALVSLGYSAKQASDMVKNLPADIDDVSERVKLALKESKK